MVEKGFYSVHEGQDYPVLRWAAGPRIGQLAPGTGLLPNHNDIAQISKDTGVKRTTQYRELLQKYLPADLDDTKKGSLGWILKQGLTALEGGDKNIDVVCPECDHKFQVVAWKRPDSNALKILLEALVGRADVTKDLNINTESIYRIIDERRDKRDIVVYEVDPQERERREAVDAEWREEL